MSDTAPAGRKRRPYAPRVPAEQRRAQLLDAALYLVVTRGHDAVSMQTVADQAGVTKPVVYGLFASRAELLAALLRRESAGALAQVVTALPSKSDPPAPDIGELLADVLHRFLRAVRANPERWYCIVMPLPAMPREFHVAREQARDAVLAHAKPLATRLLRRLEAPPELEPNIVAQTLVSLFETAARLVLTDPEQYRPERIVAALRATLGLTRPHTRSTV